MTLGTETAPEATEMVEDLTSQFENYWGTEEEFVFTLPDGKQNFTIKPLDEGGKTLFQKMTNKGIRVNQKTQDAHLDIDPASERHTLIKNSVIDYTLMVPTFHAGTQKIKSWDKHPFSKKSLEQWLEKANPKTVQELELFIRTKNPWMQDNMSTKEIDTEIDRLLELKKQASEREVGEADSANK